MNRVNNWIILTLAFLIIGIALMMSPTISVYAWVSIVLSMISLAMVVIRYEDYHKAKDLLPSHP